jgi:hypothetical protein
MIPQLTGLNFSINANLKNVWIKSIVHTESRLQTVVQMNNSNLINSINLRFIKFFQQRYKHIVIIILNFY